MELNEIKKQGKWTDISDTLNENFAKVNAETQRIELASRKNKGYFATASELTTKVPTALDGDIAYVGAKYPYNIYRWVDGAWVNSGEKGGEEVNNITNNVTNITGDVVNNPDDEDLVENNGVLKLKDRDTSKGMGYVILRTNKTFAEQVTQPNTIYEIRYDFDLGGTEVEIPKNCVLKFDGGELSNGTINANSCIVDGEPNISCTVIGFFLDNKRNKKNLISKSLTNKIIISSQVELDSAMEQAEQCIDIDAVILKGEYVIKRSYELTGNIHLIGGEGVRISYANDTYRREEAVDSDSTHYKCRIKDHIDVYSLFVEDEKIIYLSEESDKSNMVISTTKLVQDYNRETFRLPIAEGLEQYANTAKFENVFGWLDSLWRTVKFTVESSDSEYFNCRMLGSVNVDTLNGDITTYNSTLNYVLYNMKRKKGKIYYDNEYIYIPLTSDNIQVINSEIQLKCYNNITLEGITFVNCGNLLWYKGSSSASVNLYNCTFKNIAGRVLEYKGGNTSTDKDSHIINCKFTNCALAFTKSMMYVSGNIDDKRIPMTIKGCEVCQYADGFTFYKNDHSYLEFNYNVLVEDCTLYNGVRGNLYFTKGTSVVRSCKLYNTDTYNHYHTRNYSRDYGLIYCNHIASTDEAAVNNTLHTILLEGNRMYNFSGKGDTRGIFIDNGRGDITCINNVISDNESYSIDARKYTFDGTFTMASIRNRFEGNICMTPYRLIKGDGVTGENVPYASNYVLDTQQNDTDDGAEDVILNANDISVSGETIVVQKNVYINNKYIRKTNTTRRVKKINISGGKHVLHMSFNYSRNLGTGPFTIDVCDSFGVTIHIELVSFLVSDGTYRLRMNVNTAGDYLASNILMYDTKGLIDIYCTIHDGYKVKNIFQGVIVWSIPNAPLNVECISDMPNTLTNLKCHQFAINPNLNIYDPNFDNTDFDKYFRAGNTAGYQNEIYGTKGEWFAVTAWGLFRTRGTTEQRPNLIGIHATYSRGWQYYDITLNKPIWWNGTAWVDATGATV